MEEDVAFFFKQWGGPVRYCWWSRCWHGFWPSWLRGRLMGMLEKLIRMFKKSVPEPPSEAPTGPQPLRPSPMVGELHGVVGASDRR